MGTRITGMALVGAGWATTLAAVLAGRHLGRGAAVQIAFAVTMLAYAMGETLLRPAGAPGRSNTFGTVALVSGFTIGVFAGGATLGADWGTSLLTIFAVVCAFASITIQRLGRRPAPAAIDRK
jgi:hypothetical protein